MLLLFVISINIAANKSALSYCYLQMHATCAFEAYLCIRHFSGCDA